MQHYGTGLLVVLGLLLVAGPALAANDDFGGEWVLDMKRSEGTGNALKAAKQNIAVEGTDLRIQRTVTRADGEPVSFEYVYVCDGVPHKVVGPPEFEREVTAEWKGWGAKKLVVTWTMEVQGFEIPSEEIWEMKSRGLRMLRKFETPAGERVQKLYFVRPGNEK